MHRLSRVVCLFALCVLPLWLAGCSLTTDAPASPEAGAAMRGKVMGGQQPIVGAQVYLLAANAGVFTPNVTGYGNASLSLLTSGTGRTLDSSGGATNGFYYVTTDSNGAFSITGDYTCTGGQQVYLYSLSGNPGLGSGTNSGAGLLAALGTCPGTTGTTGHTFSSGLYVVMNEVSTVAAAYAMAGFATDALHVSSSGTAAAKLGIANAFLNAAELETLSTGVANLSAPAGVGTTANGGGAMPQAEINTLGNILAACVNSTGPASTACSTLFSNAMSGGTTGTAPTDTATAAINIAHNPVAAVSALYGLASAYAQFSPTLTSQPNDFTVSIYYNNSLVNQGGPLAIDGAGDIWITGGPVTELNGQGYDFTGGNGYSGVGGVITGAVDVNGNAWGITSSGLGELNSSGTLIGSYTTGLGLSSPTSIAMDASTNAWIGNSGAGNVVKVSSTGTLAGAFTGNGLSTPGPVAIDFSGNAWIADLSSGAIVELSPTGSPLSGASGYTGAGLNTPTGIAIDHNGNVWVSNSGGTYGSVTEISKTGTVLSGSGFTNSHLSYPKAIAIDGAGNAWVAGNSSTSEISPAGTFLSGSTGFAAADGLVSGIAVDGSGDVWLNYDTYNFLFGYSYYMQEIVGAATPVVTPLSVGVKNNTLGTRP